MRALFHFVVNLFHLIPPFEKFIVQQSCLVLVFPLDANLISLVCRKKTETHLNEYAYAYLSLHIVSFLQCYNVVLVVVG